MAVKKPTKPNAGYIQFKQDLKEGTLGNLYLFHGQESYLREHYLGQVRKALVDDTFVDFNYHSVEGKGLSMEALTDLVEGMPMMAERTLVVVSDLDLFKLGESQRQQFMELIVDFPDYCCLVLVYDTVDYKPNKTMKKLYKAITDHVATVEFRPADSGELLPWIARRFRALDKDIDRMTAEHLIFLCGGLMTGLVPEIAKIAAYAKDRAITIADIDAVADPVLSAEIFRLSDGVISGDIDRAGTILGDLLKMQTEPIAIVAALGSQLRRLHTARLALDTGHDKGWLMELWNMKSDYPAKLLMASAKKTTAQWCSDGVKMCQVLDRRLKSEPGIDDEAELKLLIVWLGAQKK
ncbi:DNA polymerase III subunit delta [Bengtsoniella intestinalis]|uniref:DNA polymerase III subunit delta n=1 Tax=Bengtsoniella intestinalis TaxID=3073143 RepID=UPI00391F1693